METYAALTQPMMVYLAAVEGTAVGRLGWVLRPQKAVLAAQKADLMGQMGGLTAAAHTRRLAIVQSWERILKGPVTEAAVAPLPAFSAQALASAHAFAPHSSSAGTARLSECHKRLSIDTCAQKHLQPTFAQMCAFLKS